MSEPTNVDRADWAANAADTFGQETYGGRTFGDTVAEQPTEEGDAYTMLQDLVCDLMHLAARHGWDAAAMLDKAKWHYETEVDEERAGEQEAGE